MSITDTLLDIIAKEAQLPRERIALDATLADLDVHSLDAIQVIFALEDHYDITVPEQDTNFATATVADLVRVIETQLAKKSAAAS
jgi:acyl carrier protein